MKINKKYFFQCVEVPPATMTSVHLSHAGDPVIRVHTTRQYITALGAYQASLPQPPVLLDRRFEKRFEAILRISVNDRLQSRFLNDQSPIAVLFSGGVDSLLLTALVAELLPGKR